MERHILEHIVRFLGAPTIAVHEDKQASEVEILVKAMACDVVMDALALVQALGFPAMAEQSGVCGEVERDTWFVVKQG
jgi:hypothetical protein